MRCTYATCMQSMKSVSQDVYEKTEGQTDKQTNKPTKQLEGYSRHSRQPSLNDSHLLLVSANIIESKNSGSKTD